MNVSLLIDLQPGGVYSNYSVLQSAVVENIASSLGIVLCRKNRSAADINPTEIQFISEQKDSNPGSNMLILESASCRVSAEFDLEIQKF